MEHRRSSTFSIFPQVKYSILTHNTGHRRVTGVVTTLIRAVVGECSRWIMNSFSKFCFLSVMQAKPPMVLSSVIIQSTIIIFLQYTTLLVNINIWYTKTLWYILIPFVIHSELTINIILLIKSHFESKLRRIPQLHHYTMHSPNEIYTWAVR